MANTLQEIKCPFCTKTLYRIGLLDTDVWAKTKDSPPINNDAEGDFMICPHCSRRVKMERVPSRVGAGFQVAKNQK